MVRVVCESCPINGLGVDSDKSAVLDERDRYLSEGDILRPLPDAIDQFEFVDPEKDTEVVVSCLGKICNGSCTEISWPTHLDYIKL